MSYRPTLERRQRRSSNAATALGLQLEHALSSGRLDALVLADSQGMVVAAAGDLGLCEALSALAPLGARGRSSFMGDLVGGADVAVKTLRPHGSPMFLAAVGGTSARDALLAHAASGVERILVMN